MDGLFFLELMADLRPTQEMADEAQRGLDWRGEFGRGGTAVGIARARDIANRTNLSPDTVNRMVSFFARHEVDKQAQGFRPGEDGYPSNGRIAWALWGGDPGWAWAKEKQKELEKSIGAQMEHKEFPAIILQTDEDQGIVEHIVAVMGVIDLGGDRIHNGAFTKTLVERGQKVRVLDQHQTDSIMRAVGKPLEMREMHRGELPQELLQAYPDATGALWCKTQFLMNTPEGRGAFERIKSGAVNEWSFGYDALDKDFEKLGEKSVRNLRTLKLYEYSPVLWGMNPATMTLGAKAMSEQKPYRAILEDDMWRVYRVNEDGEPTGEPLGEHETEDAAQEQVAALYAADGAEKQDAPEAEVKVMATVDGVEYPTSAFLVIEDREKPSTWHLRVRDENGDLDRRLMGAAWAALHGGYRGNRYEGPGKEDAIAELTRLYEEVGADTPKEGKAGRVFSARNAERILAAMTALGEALSEAGIEWPMVEEEEDNEEYPPAETMGDNPENEQKAGPPPEAPTPVAVPDTTENERLLQLIDIELATLEV